MKRWLPLLIAVPVLTAIVVWHDPILRWFMLMPPGSGMMVGRSSMAMHTNIPAGPFLVGVTTTAAEVQPGDNQLTIAVTAHDAPLMKADVDAEASMPAMGTMPEMRSSATITPGPGGTYTGTLNLAMPGTWTVRIRVQSADGRTGTVSLQAATGSPLVYKGPGKAGIAYYTCSMHPSVHSATPGTCPICGMNLIPVTRQELDTGVVFADAERRQLIGVMTGTAARKDTSTDIRAAGVVAYAEPRLHDLTLRYQGWIGELFANSQGMEVAKGQPLFTLYSPELLTAQNEYLQGRSAAPGESSLRDATRQRLELWGMTPQQIVELDRRGSAQTYVPILSPVRGIIVDKEVVAGSAVQAGKLVLRIADLSEVWVEAALYEYEQASIRLGMPVTVTFDAYPGASWAGKISFLYPYMDVQTRSTRARITLANADRRLKPGMYATAQVHVPLGTRLVVPESAVIHAGATALVFLDLGEGKLKPQHVTTGILTNDGIEILSGLVPGDTVVTKATFLLAAESRLKSGAASW